ncbi:hypothetical protein PO124_22705 [Bacillus licheniformis]|nr:hypothetical protein [Bacillus licheniformis]
MLKRNGAKDQELTIGNEELIVNRVPISKRKIRGAVASFRRKTDIDELSKSWRKLRNTRKV